MQVPFETQNGTAIVGDMSDFDPIDLNEKWGLDIGFPNDYWINCHFEVNKSPIYFMKLKRNGVSKILLFFMGFWLI